MRPGLMVAMMILLCAWYGRCERMDGFFNAAGCYLLVMSCAFPAALSCASWQRCVTVFCSGGKRRRAIGTLIMVAEAQRLWTDGMVMSWLGISQR